MAGAAIRPHPGGTRRASGGHARHSRQHVRRLSRAPGTGPAAKKKSLHASKRDSEPVKQARIAYRKEIAALPLERFKFGDESGINIAMTPHIARVVCGERVHDAIPKNHGSNVTIMGALSCQCMEAVMTIEGAIDTAVFCTYVRKVLKPSFIRDDADLFAALFAGLVTDRTVLIQTQICLRAIKARTREAPDEALSYAIDLVTAADACGWFAYCGYSLQ